MKILNIIPNGLIYDGITSVVLDYFQNMNYGNAVIDFAGNKILPYAEEILKKKKSKFYLLKGRTKNPLKYYLDLKKIIKDNKYDIVHVHGSSTILFLELLAAKKGGCQVRIVHSHNTKTEHKFLNLIFRPLFDYNYTKSLSCGQAAGLWLFKKENFEILHNARSIENYRFNSILRKKIRDEYCINDCTVIGCVGGFNYQKNHSFLIKVFNELKKNSSKKYKLVLIGDGILKKAITDEIKEYNLTDDVIFTGKINNVNEWLNAFDLFLLTSRYEGLPTVIVESQINNLKCLISDKITTEVKITELVEFESIMNNPKVWADKINQIDLNDRSNDKQMISKLKKEGYDIKLESQRLFDIYGREYENCGNNRYNKNKN